MSSSTAPGGAVSEWRRELLSVLPHNRAHWGAVRAAIVITVPIATLALTGHADLTLYATFGAMAGVFGRHATYSARLYQQAVAGLSLSLAVFVGTAVGVVAPGSFLAVGAIAALSLVGLLVSKRVGLLPVPSLFLVFAAGSTSSFHHAPADLVLAAALPLGAAALAIVVGQVGRILPPSRATKHPRREIVPLRAVLAAPGARLEMVRYVVGPLVAGAIATGVGIGHPYWAAVAATVPLTGATLGAKFGRGTQRLVGTVVGVLLAAALIGADPPLGVLIAAVGVAQLLAELFVLRNYALATMAVTPLALIMVHLASPAPLGTLIADRLVETVIGVLVALVLLVVTSPRRRART
ncbi:fusaric acid resistance family protein [Frondihabitans sp. PhB188]|uniref:FUSC family protein n=1 Tax=Frondihabitans sp. PhB188 TaxID=2485200 RepID=UPI000F47A3E1|nr:FUSC family protein [Frondihabitans sp. PhB188]ROQ38683.1 fusaric acid resistance family protein [Frondihabitans sp. PhB188]